MRHRFNPGDNVRVTRDLTGDAPEYVGLSATVKEQVSVGGKPGYKVLVFGRGEVRGGMCEVLEREIETEGGAKR